MVLFVVAVVLHQQLSRHLFVGEEHKQRRKIGTFTNVINNIIQLLAYALSRASF